MGRDLEPLVYNGTIIHAKAEMLSLTDMWKAAGSPANKEPYNWARKEGAAFIEAVAVAHNLTDGQVMITKKGKGGGTFAHWQIALAYAKYLDHAFHMWCNTVVRERMEGRPVGIAVDALADLERTLGIMKATIHKVTLIERSVERLEAAHVAPTFDLASSVTSDQMIDMAGVEKKDRVRGTSNMVTSAMLTFCNAVGCFRTPDHLNPSMPWRFPREKAAEWLFGVRMGAEAIRNQIARVKAKRTKVKGQGSLRLVPPERETRV